MKLLRLLATCDSVWPPIASGPYASSGFANLRRLGRGNEREVSSYDVFSIAKLDLILFNSMSAQKLPKPEECPPSIPEIMVLARALADDWKPLCRVLGVQDAEIKQIDHDESTLIEKSYKGLVKWLECSGTSATYSKLADGLKDERVQRNDLAEKYCYSKSAELLHGCTSVESKAVRDAFTDQFLKILVSKSACFNISICSCSYSQS